MIAEEFRRAALAWPGVVEGAHMNHPDFRVKGKMDGISPGPGGALVYLNVDGDLDGVLKRIPSAGGAVIKPRTSIGEHGFIAIFKDTEGNSVGLHSMV